MRIRWLIALYLLFVAGLWYAGIDETTILIANTLGRSDLGPKITVFLRALTILPPVALAGILWFERGRGTVKL